MKYKEKLEARKAKLEEKRATLLKRSDDSQDVAEVRAIGERLREIVEDIRDIENELLAIAEEESGAVNPDAAQGGAGDERSFRALDTYGAEKTQARSIDATNEPEYRAAFRDLVTAGKAIPQNVRDNVTTLTGDAPGVIPTVLMDRIIEGITAAGMILPEVTRTAYASGVAVPVSSVKPVATWVAEGAGSDAQKKPVGKVTFASYKLRCEVSISAELGAMAISAFEDAFVANVVDAMTVAIEKAILAGTGATTNDQPTGILTQSVPEGQTIVLKDTKTHIPTYKELVAAEAALPAEYENTARWFMTKKQFMRIIGMTDDSGNPIARADYAIADKPVRRILGREVIVHPYATEMGAYCAGIYDFRDYVVNTIYDLGIQQKQDWDTEDLCTKAVMSLDGKPVSVASLVVMQ